LEACQQEIGRVSGAAVAAEPKPMWPQCGTAMIHGREEGPVAGQPFWGCGPIQVYGDLKISDSVPLLPKRRPTPALCWRTQKEVSRVDVLKSELSATVAYRWMGAELSLKN